MSEGAPVQPESMRIRASSRRGVLGAVSCPRRTYRRKARPGGDSVKPATTGGDDLVCQVVTGFRRDTIRVSA
jgi:hypothetical protein